METTFYSQNTGRFYPFDEDAVQNTRQPVSSWTECHLDILRRGFADLGIVVLSSNDGKSRVDAVAHIENAAEGLFMSVEVRAGENVYSAPRMLLVPRDSVTQRLDVQDFSTVKFAVDCDGGEMYGFVTLGYPGDIAAPDGQVLENVPIHQTCVKLVPYLRSIEVSNKDRWLPGEDEKCPKDRRPRPASWDYGDLLEDSPEILHIKAGYNCQLKVNKADNRIVIQPKPGAGMGVVAEAVPLGYDETRFENGVEAFPDMPDSNRYEPRLDAIRELPLARTFAGSYGANIEVITDRNFVSFTERRAGNDECTPFDLVIRHMGTPLQCDTSPNSPESRLTDCVADV